MEIGLLFGMFLGHAAISKSEDVIHLDHIATLPWLILYIRASQASHRLWTRGNPSKLVQDVGDAGPVIELLFRITGTLPLANFNLIDILGY